MKQKLKTRSGESFFKSSKHFSLLRSKLRQIWMWYDDSRKEIIKRIKACENCGVKITTKNRQVDHKIPAGSLRSLEDLPMFIERLHSPDLQILCKDCHKRKTNDERRAVRKPTKRVKGDKASKITPSECSEMVGR